jgi:anti-anti-sigma factor
MPCTFQLVDKTAYFRLSGRFTYEEHEEFHQALQNLAGTTAREIVIQLAEVEFIDSAGLGMLLLLKDKATQPITLSGAREQVRKILELTKLDTLFHLQ